MKQIERTIHQSKMKATRTIMQKHKSSSIIYFYFPEDENGKGVVLYKNLDYKKPFWISETTKEIKVKGGK